MLNKSNAECLESASTGHLMAQVQQEMHILNGHYQSRKGLLSVMEHRGLEGERE